MNQTITMPNEQQFLKNTKLWVFSMQKQKQGVN